MDILQRFSPSYWWTDPGTTVDGPLPILFAAVLGLVLVLSVVVWLLAPRYVAENRVLLRFVLRIAKWTLGFAAVGLLLLLFRWQIVPFFSKRIWVILWFVAIAAGIWYVVRYWRREYPARLAAWQDSERRRRYLPKAGQSAARSRRRTRRHR